MRGHLLGGDVRGDGDLLRPGRHLKQTRREGGPGGGRAAPGPQSPPLRDAAVLTSSGNSSPTSDKIRDVFPTWAARDGAVSAAAKVAAPPSRRTGPAPPRPRRSPSPSPPPAPAPTLAQQQDADVPLHGSRPTPQPQLRPEHFPSPLPTLPPPPARTSGPARAAALASPAGQRGRVRGSATAWAPPALLALRRPGGGATASGATQPQQFPAGPGPARSGQDRPCRWTGQGLSSGQGTGGLGFGQRLISGRAGEPGPGHRSLE